MRNKELCRLRHASPVPASSPTAEVHLRCLPISVWRCCCCCWYQQGEMQLLTMALVDKHLYRSWLVSLFDSFRAPKPVKWNPGCQDMTLDYQERNSAAAAAVAPASAGSARARARPVCCAPSGDLELPSFPQPVFFPSYILNGNDIFPCCF